MPFIPHEALEFMIIVIIMITIYYYMFINMIVIIIIIQFSVKFLHFEENNPKRKKEILD